MRQYPTRRKAIFIGLRIGCRRVMLQGSHRGPGVGQPEDVASLYVEAMIRLQEHGRFEWMADDEYV